MSALSLCAGSPDVKYGARTSYYVHFGSTKAKTYVSLGPFCQNIFSLSQEHLFVRVKIGFLNTCQLVWDLAPCEITSLSLCTGSSPPFFPGVPARLDPRQEMNWTKRSLRCPIKCLSLGWGKKSGGLGNKKPNNQGSVNQSGTKSVGIKTQSSASSIIAPPRNKLALQ